MKDQQTTRPSHLVISLDDEFPVAKALEGLLDTSPAAVRSAAKSMTSVAAEVFRTKSDHSTEARIYPQFNLAALDLDEAAAEGLRSSRTLVVRNEERTVQGWKSATAGPAVVDRSDATEVDLESGDTFSGIDESPKPRPSMNVQTGDSILEYVRGHRDAMDTVLRRFGSTPVEGSEAPVSEVEAAGGLEWHLRMVGIRATTTRRGDGVKVAVLDTGLDLGHPDFAGRVRPANCRSFVAGVATVDDGHGHGTHCCGLVNGPVAPAIGLRYGVAPGAELLVGKVMSDEGRGFDSEIIAGIAWAAQSGARVISLSLGSPRRIGDPSAVAYEQIARRLSQTGRDCLLVAAAGNESRRRLGRIAPVGNPAACPSFLAVAAVDRSRAVASFSCGELDAIGTLELSAPGVDVRSSVPRALAPAPSDPYEAMNGTSMATPIVAGVAALWLQAMPTLTTLALWRELIRRARPLGRRRDFGFGLVRIP